ncbi:MAG: CsbD family protein [Chitinophagaceae bacterium]|nr:MAG: CsbD family protein [Chitinophagaceae bacterium]
MKDNSGKILLALLAGASAGVVAGLLMAPETGEATRGNLRKSAGRLGKDLEGMLKQTMDKLDGLNLPAIPGMGGNKTILKGDWNDIKGKLKQRYGQLTDEDLTYTEGAADELVGNLQRALGMGRNEVEKMLNDL